MLRRMLWNKDDGTGEGVTETTTTTDSTEQAPLDKRIAGMQKAVEAERAKRQALTEKLAAFEARDTEAAEAKRLADGEAKSLLKERAAELKALREKVEASEKRETARQERIATANAAKIKALPAELQTLIPEGLDPETTQAQIANIEALMGEEDGAPIGTRSRAPNRKEFKIPQACIDEAVQYSRDPRKHYESVWKPRLERQKR